MTSLNPIFTVERQLSEPFIIHQGMNKKEAAEKVVEMLRMSVSRTRRQLQNSIRISFPVVCVSVS